MAGAARFLPWMAGAGLMFAGGASAGGGSLLQTTDAKPRWASGNTGSEEGALLSDRIPSRAQQLSKMRECTRDKPFDLLIVGGGATGTGSAVDAATRGLRTVLVEREDFASGTSSKSTKLVHGGVRYLEKAVFQLDWSQLMLVFEALHERHSFLDNASHLAHPLPTLMPCYKWWEVPFYWSGLKAYDLLAGSNNLIWSKFLGKTESVNMLPVLASTRADGRKLKGSILYYDGQFDDARVNVALACTAAAAGAAVSNYVECKSLIKNDEGKVIGARCQDKMSGEEFDVYAKVVINATGPFCDGLRDKSGASGGKAVLGASGVHITLPDYFSAGGVAPSGMIIPKTKDGRVVFMLPWLGKVIAGTTDEKCEITTRPRPSEKEIAFILEALGEYLSVDVKRSDVLSAWSGIRPLAVDPKHEQNKKGGTQNVVREHIIFTDDDGLINIAGGKWTTYRRMAQDVIDAAQATGRLPQNMKPCSTAHLKLVGAEGHHPALFTEVAQQYHSQSSSAMKLDTPAAQRLVSAYGDRVGVVLKLAEDNGLGKTLVEGHPFIEAEVLYCVQHEYCETVEDFLCRRTRLAFLDREAALRAIPRVADIMAKAHGWSNERKQREMKNAAVYLETFTAGAIAPVDDVRAAPAEYEPPAKVTGRPATAA